MKVIGLGLLGVGIAAFLFFLGVDSGLIPKIIAGVLVLAGGGMLFTDE